MDKLEPYMNELMVGVSTVGLGFLVKKGLKKDMVPVGNGKQILETFVFGLVCAFVGGELQRQIKKNQSPTPKPS